MMPPLTQRLEALPGIGDLGILRPSAVTIAQSQGLRHAGDLWGYLQVPGLPEQLVETLGGSARDVETWLRALGEAIPEDLRSVLRPIPEEVLSHWTFACRIPSVPHPVFPPSDWSSAPSAVDGCVEDIGCSEVNHIPALPEIRSQGRRGTCVAHGVLAVREFFIGPKADLSEQFLYWGCKMRDGSPDEAGTWGEFALQTLEEIGVCTEEEWPYNPEPGDTEHQGPPPPEALANAHKHKIVRGIQLPGTDVNKIRKVLAGRNGRSARPMAFAIPVFKSWLRNPMVRKKGDITESVPDEPWIGGHEMTFVGYRDDKREPGGGRFWLRNSWGKGWASESPLGAGYGTVSYAFINKHGWAAETMVVPGEKEPEKKFFFSAGDRKEMATSRTPGRVGTVAKVGLIGLALGLALAFADAVRPRPPTGRSPAVSEAVSRRSVLDRTSSGDAGREQESHLEAPAAPEGGSGEAWIEFAEAATAGTIPESMPRAALEWDESMGSYGIPACQPEVGWWAEEDKWRPIMEDYESTLEIIARVRGPRRGSMINEDQHGLDAEVSTGLPHATGRDEQ